MEAGVSVHVVTLESNFHSLLLHDTIPIVVAVAQYLRVVKMYSVPEFQAMFGHRRFGRVVEPDAPLMLL